MKNKLIFTLTVALFLFVFQADGRSILKLQEAELEAVDKSNKTLVFGGKKYNYKFDPENSRYKFRDDLKKSINLSSLKVNEKYFFQYTTTAGSKKFSQHDTVIFIAKSKPSE